MRTCLTIIIVRLECVYVHFGAIKRVQVEKGRHLGQI